MPDAAILSDEELHRLFGGTAAGASDVSGMTDDELHKLFTGAKEMKQPAPVATLAPVPQIANPELTNNPDMPPGTAVPVPLTPEQRATANAGLAGVGRGVRDVADPLARVVSSPFGQGDAVAAGNQNDLADYQQTYGNNPLASVGRGVGQAGAVAPIMAVVNPAIGALGRGISYLGGQVSPVVGNALGYIGDFLGGTAGGPGVVGRTVQAGSRAAQGAALGGEAAALTSGQSNEPLEQQVRQGAATGAVLGPAIPAAAEAGAGAYKALTGGAALIPREVAQLAQMGRDNYGIMLKAPQIGMSPTLRYANNALKMVPGSGAGAETAQVQTQFNRAVANTFGENADRITPDVLSQAQRRIGGVLNTVENGAQVHLDNQFVNQVAAIEANARSSLPDSEFGVVRRQLDNIFTNLQPGDTITGTTYGNLIHKGSPLDAALNSRDANIRNYAGQIREALRDSLTRSLSPADADAYQLARTQYKNLKTVEPLTLRADTTGGAAPSTGDVSPAALRAAVNRSFGTNIAQAVPGQVPLNDLARIGQLMKEPPTSGTAERGSMLALGAKAAELGGAIAAGHYAGVLPAAVTLAAGMAGGRLAGEYLRSNFLARRLIDSALSTAPVGNPLAAQLQPYIGPAGVIVRNQLAAPVSP